MYKKCFLVNTVLFLVMILTLFTDAAEVEVVKPGSLRSAIDLSGFDIDGSETCKIVKQTLVDDLERSGWFTVVQAGQSAISLSGRCRKDGDRLFARCVVRSRRKKYLSEDFDGMAEDPRGFAHRIADRIVEAIKGVKGIASTRIAMVGVRGGKRDLYICDADGKNFLQLTRDGSVCISPSWFPDGRSLTYTSFHGGFPDVYLINLETHSRKKILSYPGLNLGASISPDGKSLVATLSKDGNPELYVMSLKNGSLKRLTRTPHAVEASPVWSPDGKKIAYVSDESGLPQIYITSAAGGRSRLLTYRGSQNVSPDWGAGGLIVYSSKRGIGYQICVKHPEQGKSRELTSVHADHENPSWAPDGRHVVYTMTKGYKSNLYILDTLGGSPLLLTKVEGDWHSASWSPR